MRCLTCVPFCLWRGLCLLRLPRMSRLFVTSIKVCASQCATKKNYDMCPALTGFAKHMYVIENGKKNKLIIHSGEVSEQGHQLYSAYRLKFLRIKRLFSPYRSPVYYYVL
ncbi:unnamed protein product [Absidia cylindrospora]